MFFKDRVDGPTLCNTFKKKTESRKDGKKEKGINEKSRKIKRISESKKSKGWSKEEGNKKGGGYSAKQAGSRE